MRDLREPVLFIAQTQGVPLTCSLALFQEFLGVQHRRAARTPATGSKVTFSGSRS
jgi:hypothetical protein